MIDRPDIQRPPPDMFRSGDCRGQAKVLPIGRGRGDRMQARCRDKAFAFCDLLLTIPQSGGAK